MTKELRFASRQGKGIFPFDSTSQTDTGAHTAPLSMSAGALIHGIGQPGRECNSYHLLPALRIVGAILPVPIRLRGVHRDNFMVTVREKCILLGCSWPRGRRRGSAAARLLGLWVRIPPGTWMFVSCEYCVLSARGLCDGLITRSEESYRL